MLEDSDTDSEIDLSNVDLKKAAKMPRKSFPTEFDTKMPAFDRKPPPPAAGQSDL